MSVGFSVIVLWTMLLMRYELFLMSVGFSVIALWTMLLMRHNSQKQH
jgi:hypothetical protein